MLLGDSNLGMFGSAQVESSWDVSTITADGSFVSGTLDDPNTPRCFTLSADGTNLYIGHDTPNGAVGQFTLSTPWDVATASYVRTKAFSAQDTSIQGISLSADGTKLILHGITNKRLYEYTLTTPFNISTATFVRSYNLSVNILGNGKVDDAGTRCLLADSTSSLLRTHILAAAWDLSSVNASGPTFAPGWTTALHTTFSPDGKHLALLNAATMLLYMYELTTPFNVSTAVAKQSKLLTAFGITNADDLAFSPDGAYLYVMDGFSGKKIWQFEFGTVSTPPVWRAFGSTFALALGTNAITKFTNTRVAIMDSGTTFFRALDFSAAAAWSAVGTNFFLNTNGFPALAEYSSTKILSASSQLGTIRGRTFNGSTWSEDASSVSIAGAGQVALTRMGSTGNRYAYLDPTLKSLRAYTYDGTTIAQEGNSYAVPGALGQLCLAGMSATRVAVVDASTSLLRVFDFDGTDWAPVGTPYDIYVTEGIHPYSFAMCALDETSVALVHAGTPKIKTYKFDGTNWVKYGTEGNVSSSINLSSLARISATRVAHYDNGAGNLRMYDFL